MMCGDVSAGEGLNQCRVEREAHALLGQFNPCGDERWSKWEYK